VAWLTERIGEVDIKGKARKQRSRSEAGGSGGDKATIACEKLPEPLR
jgi:hypothetical protein